MRQLSTIVSALFIIACVDSLSDANDDQYMVGIKSQSTRRTATSLRSELVSSFFRSFSINYFFTSHTTSTTLRNFNHSHDLESFNNFTFSCDVMHQDNNGSILIRFKNLNCYADSCNRHIPDIFIKTNENGTIFEELYVVRQYRVITSWNTLFAVVYILTRTTMSFDDGQQKKNLNTEPYGDCHQHYSKNSSESFRLQLDNCHLDHWSKGTFKMTNQSYRQDMNYTKYMVENLKIIDSLVAEEVLELSSFVDPYWYLKVKTRLQLKRHGQGEFHETNRYCTSTMPVSLCAEAKFFATSLGTNWMEIKSNLEIKMPPSINKISSIIDELRYSMEGSAEFSLMMKQPRIFAELVDALRHITLTELSMLMNELKYEKIMPIVIRAIAASNNFGLHQAMKDILTDELHLEIYMHSLMLVANVRIELIDHLERWLRSCDTTRCHEKLAAVIVVLYRRYCESSARRLNACNRSQFARLNEFITAVTKCNAVVDCHIIALKLLTNIPLNSTVEYAKQFICARDLSLRTAQLHALRVLSLADKMFLDEQVTDKLLRVFRNTCIHRQSLVEQNLAAEILLGLATCDNTTTARLLQSEKLIPENHDKWAYYFGIGKQKRLMNTDVDNYWRKMRSLYKLKPNYAQRGLQTLTNVLTLQLPGTPENRLFGSVKIEFDRDAFRHSDFAFNLIDSNDKLIELIGLSVDANGIHSAFSNSNCNEEDTNDSTNPYADFQLRILKCYQPHQRLFNSSSELLGLAWNADGSPKEAFTTDFIAERLVKTIPLLNGQLAYVDIAASVSIKLVVSASVSLWNRNTYIVLNVQSPLNLFGSIRVNSSASNDGVISSLYQAGVVHEIISEIEFASSPQRFCTKFHQPQFTIKRMFSVKDEAEQNPRRWYHKKIVPGCSYSIDHQLSKMCNHLEGRF